MAYHPAVPLAELAPGVGRLVELNGKKIALFLTEGQVYAIDEICPHRGAPMHEGECEGLFVTCPWHNASFDLQTGKHQCPPAKSDLAVYPVRVVGETVEIDVG
ncbi:Rieske (2Fe-2S) protein [Tuwongella immobilis]|uniref:Rieske domain-containing protein n=1 Tax=Tuwongella immobilis TaxID=692036 RepID=A0A6C2YLE6_9BACT|nr:Rieske (2Fe-2S) protein [Tuwongella immobilis]VIP01943.1 naphthalene -dioxygenase system ferredoxin subunit : Putative biphenyl dioxygenase system ferredoxin component OS=Leptospira santarosai str. 2000030832 GN=LEP1GSC040_0039 PE=4 SV=1: Rieske_2 [Tuwongella immobilis]VTR99917.1 naphthalene -dioxygenase system ferredoxin subunit : Putative biphenyl dioxygenase system ferredoxin component OS=Leptospira santarosai str. 2000030832 GN=LEP1GSC040_0039 PE=4 SV=1: Rieske_2 [Tuwongella immobilis]